jgi:Uma2 family endonuclease
MSIHEPLAAPSEESPQSGISTYRFTVEQYHQMAAAGILEEDERVQLLEGEIVCMTPIGPLHRYAVVAAGEALSKLLPAEWKLMIQQPITLAESEPEPDLCIVRSESARYLDRHPGPADVCLVIEVADSSLPLDRNRKQTIYAAAGIPEYWIVNLDERSVEVYREPGVPIELGRAAYSARQTFGAGAAVPLRIGERECGSVAVAELAPKIAEGRL